MRSKLNPDGARIRVLRVQRGWTQEQLAEIAGISSRTVQRAETANCASFETLRAMAGAFEMDFDQLLKSEAHAAPDPEPQIANSAYMPSSERKIDPIPANLPKPERRTWAMPLLSLFTLVMGLFIGAMLKPLFNVDQKPHSAWYPSISGVRRQIETSREPVQPVSVARKEDAIRKAPSPLTKAPAPNRTFIITESLPNSNPLKQPSEMPITADPASQDIIQPSQASGSLDLPLQSHTLLSELVIPEADVPASETQVLSENRTPDEQDSGAVRQAVDLAAKKTGSFVSKISTSIRRVF